MTTSQLTIPFEVREHECTAQLCAQRGCACGRCAWGAREVCLAWRGLALPQVRSARGVLTLGECYRAIQGAACG